jgi:ribosomal protein S12 methylthiotransferase
MSDRRRRSGARPPRIHLASLGCAKNLVDSERLLARLAIAGGLVGAPPEEADVILVNTCGFIAAAIEESLDVIEAYAEMKTEGRPLRLLVLGCLVERDRAALRKRLPSVDGFFGLDEHEAIVSACGLAPAPEDGARLLLTPPHTAYLRISEGCDNRCTFCTIPSIRGSFRSRPPQDILREAEELVAGGVRELNLIGQDTTAYGRDLPTTYPLDRLVREIAAIDDLRWLRLLYAYPAHVTDDLIDAIDEAPKICRYIDLPLQHLDDAILRRMGRRATRADTLHLIERIRDRLPDVTIRTTFIVGFPGETDAQFDELLSLVAQLRFDHVGVFAYSREEGTPAAALPDQIPPAEKERRVGALMLLQQRIALERNRERIGSHVEVLVDGPSESRGLWIARTEGQAPDVDSVTLVASEGLTAGRFVDVEITDADGYDLIARPLGKLPPSVRRRSISRSMFP